MSTQKSPRNLKTNKPNQTKQTSENLENRSVSLENHKMQSKHTEINCISLLVVSMWTLTFKI